MLWDSVEQLRPPWGKGRRPPWGQSAYRSPIAGRGCRLLEPSASNPHRAGLLLQLTSFEPISKINCPQLGPPVAPLRDSIGKPRSASPWFRSIAQPSTRPTSLLNRDAQSRPGCQPHGYLKAMQLRANPGDLPQTGHPETQVAQPPLPLVYRIASSRIRHV